MLMRIFTHCLFFQCVFINFQCLVTLLRALSVALINHYQNVAKSVESLMKNQNQVGVMGKTRTR